MNISHLCFILFNLKIFGEIVINIQIYFYLKLVSNQVRFFVMKVSLHVLLAVLQVSRINQLNNLAVLNLEGFISPEIFI